MLSKLKSHLEWLTFHGTILALTVFGFIYDVDGARNILGFIVWFFFLPMSVIMLSDWAVDQMASTKRTPHAGFRKAASLAIFASCLLIMVWHGAWITAIAFVVQRVFMEASSMAVQEKIKGSN